MEQTDIIVRTASYADVDYASIITTEMEASAKARGTGIAKRSPDYVALKMEEGKAVIALTTTGEWVGFCYIEAWGDEKYLANSGLIVSPAFRKTGVAKRIKEAIFKLSRKKYPEAKIFGLTTSSQSNIPQWKSVGKTYIKIHGNITNEQAAIQLTNEFGTNTEFIWIENTTSLTSIDLNGVARLFQLRIYNNALSVP